MSSGWESSDLLTRFNLMAGRPDNDALSDTKKYQFLADAQQSVFTQMVSCAPRVLYGAPQPLQTSDGGYTWQFGVDGDGYLLFPLGKASIYPNLDAIPGYAWTPGIDYLDEGTQIRIPNNQSWNGQLYWYGITPPAELSATVAPILQPPASRVLIAIEAVRQFAESFARNPALESMMAQRFARDFGPWMTTIRTHFRGGMCWTSSWRGGAVVPGWGFGVSDNGIL
jgi:hypothetical protein